MDTTVMLGHGSGGTMMKRIIDEVFFAAYAGDELLRGDDAAVLPALGLYARGYFFWDPLHAASAKVLLALLLVHLALNASAVVRAVRARRCDRP